MPRSRWYCASLSVGYDLVTASFSVADMVCDYLVLLQCYTDGRPVFFALSLVVMLLAHATYACLFTQKYVPDHTTNQHGRLVAVQPTADGPSARAGAGTPRPLQTPSPGQPSRPQPA